MADNCVCAQPGEYHLRSDHRHNGDDCLVAYDERCPCKKFRLGERVDVAAENARLQERVEWAQELGRRAWVAVGRLVRERDALQARVEETHGRGVWLWNQLQATATAILRLTIDGIHLLESERDEARALAERRKEALVGSGIKWPIGEWHLLTCDRYKDYSATVCSISCTEARAAIEEEGKLVAALERFANAVEQHDWLALIDIAGWANAGENGLLVNYEVEGDYANDARYVWPKRMSLLIHAARAALGEET